MESQCKPKTVDLNEDPLTEDPNSKALHLKEAPPFELPIAQGGTFNLHSVLQRGPVILNFIRGTWCPYCQLHMGNIRKWQKSISLKSSLAVTIVVISNEKLQTIRDWLKTNNVTFLFLSDSDGEVAKKFGVYDDQNTHIRPATFLIEKDGSVIVAHQGKRTENLEEKIIQHIN